MLEEDVGRRTDCLTCEYLNICSWMLIWNCFYVDQYMSPLKKSEAANLSTETVSRTTCCVQHYSLGAASTWDKDLCFQCLRNSWNRMHASSGVQSLHANLQVLIMVHLDRSLFLFFFFPFKLGYYLDKNCPIPVGAGDFGAWGSQRKEK